MTARVSSAISAKVINKSATWFVGEREETRAENNTLRSCYSCCGFHRDGWSAVDDIQTRMPSLACVAHFSLEQFCISLQAISLITATFHLPPLTISLCLGFILLICSWLLISGYSGKLSITYCRSSMYVFHQKWDCIFLIVVYHQNQFCL